MASEGSTAWRGVTELGNTLKDHHDTIPERVYIYADGGGDRRITYLQVQLIAMFLCYDLDELISARLAAGCSYRYPIERCHAIANLGFQSVGLMPQSMIPETKRIIKNLNSTADIRKAFTTHKDLEKKLIDSLEPAKCLVETVLTRLSLKDKKFKIFSAATDNEIENLKKSLSVSTKILTLWKALLISRSFRNVMIFLSRIAPVGHTSFR